jgi:uncharacterized protein YjbI with pentapeptide repeats
MDNPKNLKRVQPISSYVAWFFCFLTAVGVLLIASTEFQYSDGYFLQPFVKANGDDLNAKGKLIYYLIILAGAFATLALSLRRHHQTDLDRDITEKKLKQDEVKIAQDKSLADDKLYAEIYVKAVEQLGKTDDKRHGDTAAIELRIGGLYALESLARNMPEDYKEIVLKVITAYIRENARRPQRATAERNRNPSTKAVALPEDVVVAFRVLNDLVKRFEWKTPIDFEGVDFEQVDFARVDFPNCTLNLRSANLNNADLRFAQLNGACLDFAQLNRADLRDAQLNGACLDFAKLNGADLRNAQLNGTDLSYAQLNSAEMFFAVLNGADLSYAQLIGADLRYVQLNGTDLSYAQLKGTDLRNAQLNGVELISAENNSEDLISPDLNCTDLRHLSLEAMEEKQREHIRKQLTPFRDNENVARLLERLDDDLAKNDPRLLIEIFPSITTCDCLHDGSKIPAKNSGLFEAYLGDYAQKFASCLDEYCTDEIIVAAFVKRMRVELDDIFYDDFQKAAWQALRAKLGKELLSKNADLWNALSDSDRAYLSSGKIAPKEGL